VLHFVVEDGTLKPRYGENFERRGDFANNSTFLDMVRVHPISPIKCDYRSFMKSAIFSPTIS